MPLPPTFPDLVSLDLFVTVARLGSVSRAAEVHQLSQPSVSNRLTRLERQLKLTLLDRGPSGSVPTPEGALVAEWASALLDAAELLRVGAASLSTKRRSRLRVAASFTVAEHLLPGWLGTFHRVEPLHAVELEVINSTMVLERLRSGSTSLGFIESPDRAAGLRTQVVAVDELVVIVSPTHPWVRRRAPLNAEDLAATPLVMREVGSGTRETLDVRLKQHGQDPVEPALELGSNTAVRAAVAAGVAPGVLSRLAVVSELESGRLVAVAFPNFDLTRELRAVWNPGVPDAAARALVTIAASGRELR